MFEYHMSSYMHRLCIFGQVLVFTVCGHKYTYIEYYYQLKWIFIHLYIIGTVYKYHRYDIQISQVRYIDIIGTVYRYHRYRIYIYHRYGIYISLIYHHQKITYIFFYSTYFNVSSMNQILQTVLKVFNVNFKDIKRKLKKWK